MNKNIKEWYTMSFETDELGAELNEVTFHELHKALHDGKDIYEIMGVDDSLIRERLFLELAELLQLDYANIYILWLDNMFDKL